MEVSNSMKIHITNQYPYRYEERINRIQHTYCKAGKELGFQEMGIYTYPAETDIGYEMRKRIDGIVASLESDDIIFVQLPTGNGLDFENLFVNVLKVYKNTRVVFLIHDTSYIYEEKNNISSKAQELLHKADLLLLSDRCEKRRYTELGFTNLLFANDVRLAGEVLEATRESSIKEGQLCPLYKSDFWYKKILLDALTKCYECENDQALAETKIVEEEIHIGFGVHDKTGDYTAWVGVAMLSLIEHTGSKICFHIVHDETLSDLNRDRLVQLAIINGHRIFFHLLNANAFISVKEQMRFYTIGAMFRVVLPEILSELSKIIYLDADILANRDIKELWEIDITNYAMAAVADMDVVNGKVRPLPVKKEQVDRERYFNSGVLYLNMEKIRAMGNMRELVLNYLQEEKESDLPDQDALNVLYGQETLLIDGDWNYFVKNVRQLKDNKLQSKFYHYVGTGCFLYYNMEVDELYYTTIMRTPWGDKVGKSILERSLVRATDRAEWLEKVIKVVAKSDKKLIFYGKETMAMNNIYKMLTIKEGDYRVLSVKEDDAYAKLPCKDLQTLKNEKDYVVFVLPDADSGNSINNLENMGLVRNSDYFVIPYLLFPLDGGYV